MGAIDPTAWNLKREHLHSVQAALDAHLLRHYIPWKNRNGRKKQRFCIRFLRTVESWGGTAEAAEMASALLCGDPIEEELLNRSLCIQWPFDRYVVMGLKDLGLRKTRLGKAFKGKACRVFINESGTKTKFAYATTQRQVRGKTAGHIVGDVQLTGEYIVLTRASLNEALAARAMLTLKALVEAFKAGYKFAWVLAFPRQYQRSFVAKDRATNRKTAQIWTVMDVPCRGVAQPCKKAKVE